MSTMSRLRRKMTAHQYLRIQKANKETAIRIERNNPDYREADKATKRSRIAAIFRNFQFKTRRAS